MSAERPIDSGPRPEGGTPPEGAPTPGTIVRDTAKDQVVIVMGALGPYVQVRPLGGGLERDVKPDGLQRLTPREELSARLAVRNAFTRWGV